MRLLFAGTPQVAVASLDALVRSQHDVVAVLTRPDTVAGRGRRPVRSAVAERADALGLPVSTLSPRDPGFAPWLAGLAVDCCPVVAFGALIPPEALDIPAQGWVNLHFSLLPQWRGAAPVQHAVLNGDTVTGASTFRLDAGLDTGPVFDTVEEPIGPRDTGGDILDRLARRGATLIVSTMDGLADGSLVAVPQPDGGATDAPKFDVADARVAWAASAQMVDRLVRACTPAPGAWTTFRGERIKVEPVTPTGDSGLVAGEIRAEKSAVTVGTGTTAVLLGAVTPQGKRPMAAADWARGVRPEQGEAFE